VRSIALAIALLLRHDVRFFPFMLLRSLY
jgi:hypothetical protein